MKHLALAAAVLATAYLTPALAADHPATEEHLIVGSYPADPPWKKITDGRNAIMAMREWTPEDQPENAIKDILTEQQFFTIAGTDAAAYVARFLKDFAGHCRSAKVNGPKAGTQNGYAIAYGQIYCLSYKDSGLDADIFLKAISGRKAFYLVQREWRRPAEPGGVPGVRQVTPDDIHALAVADKFLVDQVELCPQANGDQCPLDKGMTPH